MKKISLWIIFLVCTIMVSCEDNQPDFNKAAIMSEDFVKPRLNFPEEAVFNEDSRGSETSEYEYDVLKKFTSKNAFGVKVSHIYKIHMIYKSEDWTDINNWTYNLLKIENIPTGEHLVFYSPED